MKRKKRTKDKKTGRVIKVDAEEIELQTAGEGTWLIKNKTNSTKVIEGELKLDSTVTVEFNRGDGERIDAPGKRTEFGTVIGLTASQIRLQVPHISLEHANAGNSGTFTIDIHTNTDPIDTVTIPSLDKLKVGSGASVSSNEEDWTPFG